MPRTCVFARISVIAASALLGACGGKSALHSGGADGESPSSAGGRGGRRGSDGTSGNTSFAGSSGSGGSVGAGGSGPTLGAGFPICPGYNEPQICSAEGAECLDVSPCESGCRRIRSICTSGFWAPDGGTACGFACSDGAAPTTCEIDEIGGIFEASYIKEAGDCELDHQPGGPVPLVSGMVGTETGGAFEIEDVEVFANRCKLSYSLAYEQETDSVRWTFWLVQLDEEGTVLQGAARVVMSTGLSTCLNFYAVRFDKRP